MASNGSSEADPEEDNGECRFSAEKTGRAADFPDFAIIWSFLENFKHLLHFPDLSLDSLEDGFNSHSRENGNVETVEELYKKLLRRIGISVNPDKWEKSLLKAAKEQSLDCAWDLEQFGYEELNVSSKLELFKVLLECQFDQNDKLKSSINKAFEAEELRMQPVGRDLDGFIYWYHEDECNGVRLYLTEEDEVNSESWRLVAGLTDELAAVVEFLESKSEVNPKDIALARREEMKKKREVQSPGKKKGKKAKKQDSIPEDDYDDDNPCARCFSNVRPDSILLCDKCDAAYHTACLRPPLLTVPQGDWYCPFCQQLALLEVLREKKLRLAARTRLRQRQAKRLGFAGIDLNNILEPNSDDEDDLGIRRSGRSRKTVDYTFKEFEDDITSAVENDRKRFNNQEEVNGDDHLLYSKPAFESGRFYGMRETRRSRRLRDLDYESDSESRTSGYENEGNSDEDGQRISFSHARVKRHRRLIVEDDDDYGDRNGSSECDKDSNELVNETNDARKEAEQSDQKNHERDVVAAKNNETPNSGLEKGGDKVSSNSVQSVSDTRSDVSRVSSSPQTHSTSLQGNKIHPHSRIASVAPVTRNQPPNYPLPPGYNQRASFPSSSELEAYEQQRFPPKQSTEYSSSKFGGLAVGARDSTRVNLGIDGSSPAGVGVPVVPGGRFVPGSAATNTHLGGSSFPCTTFGGVLNPRTSFGAANMSGGGALIDVSGSQYADANISGTNFGGSGLRAQSVPSRNVAAPNILRAGLGTNFGGSDFCGTNATGYDTMKSPVHNATGSLWGSPSKPGNSYGYSSFSPMTGTAPPSSAAMNSPHFPSSYDQTAGYSDSSQYGSFNQQLQAGCHMQTNYFPSQQSGNYQGSGFLSPTSQRPPPPPYSATNSVNANFYPNNTQEAPRTDGQWSHPEGYGYFAGQATGQNF